MVGAQLSQPIKINQMSVKTLFISLFFHYLLLTASFAALTIYPFVNFHCPRSIINVET